MKKTSIIWTVVVVVIIVLGAYLWWASMAAPYQAGTNQSAGNGTSTASQSSANGSSNGSNGANGGNGSNGTTTGPFVQPTLSLNTSNGDTMGYHLVGANGMTLYEYNKDAANVSNCNGTCATNWPPYTVNARQATELTGGASINGKIGTMKRADGSLQVTYDNIPLYFYSGDKAIGDTKGQGVNGFTTIAP